MVALDGEEAVLLETDNEASADGVDRGGAALAAPVREGYAEGGGEAHAALRAHPAPSKWATNGPREPIFSPEPKSGSRCKSFNCRV